MSQLNKYSKTVTQDPTQPAAQAMLHAIGLTKEDFYKPIIGIASTGYEGNPCNMHLNDLAKLAKQGTKNEDVVGLIFNTDFKDLKWVAKEGTLNEAGEKVGEVAVLYGEFITNVLDFVIVAFVMFMLIKGIEKTKKKKEEAPAAPKGPTQEELLMEIRDALKKQ